MSEVVKLVKFGDRYYVEVNFTNIEPEYLAIFSALLNTIYEAAKTGRKLSILIPIPNQIAKALEGVKSE